MLKENKSDTARTLPRHLRRFVPRTVRATLAWLLAGVVGPLAIATAGLFVAERRAQEAETRERLGTIASSLVAAVDAELERDQALLEVLAASPQLNAGDFQGLYAYAKQVTVPKTDMAIVLVSADGQPVFSTGVEWGAVLPNIFKTAQQKGFFDWNGTRLPISSGDLVSRVLHSKRVEYSNLYYAANVNRPALAIGVPAAGPEGAPHAFLLSLSPSVLQNTVRSSVSVPRVRVVVVDRSGLVVATNAASTAEIGRQLAMTPAMLQQATGFYSTTALDGSALDGAFAVSKKNGFVVRVAEPAEALVSGGSTLAWIGLYAAVSIAGTALVRIHSRRLTAPIGQLATAVSRGEAPSLEGLGHLAEIELLARAVGVAAEAATVQQQADQRLMCELEDRARFSEQMVGIVSHDLRHPLLAAQLSIRAVQGQQSPSTDELGRIEVAVAQAQAMVTELLDFTRARIGNGIPVDLQPSDIHHLLRDHLNTLTRSYSQSRLVHDQVGHGPCEVDRARVIQLLDNLVSNAVAYGSPHKPVSIRSVVADDFFSIEVHNEGDPIAADILPQVFEPMVRSSTARATRPGGVGLGLYIVRKIVEAHAGEIKVASSHETGTTFTATFPR